MKTQIKWGKVALRLLVLPFYVGWVGIFTIRLFAVKIIDFLLYGGELITYNKTMNSKTIGETYDLILKQNGS